MNPDNPYAAPQTVVPRLDLSALPIAELQQPGGKRRRYPERSTAELQRLFDQSQPLEAMFLVWLALWFLAVAVTAAYYLNPYRAGSSNVWVWCGIACVTMRFWCSIWRTKLGRWFMLLADAALSCTCLALIYALGFRIIAPSESSWIIGSLSLILFTIAAVTFRSCQTIIKARALFHPSCVQHDDLMRELSYRKEQRID